MYALMYTAYCILMYALMLEVSVMYVCMHTFIDLSIPVCIKHAIQTKKAC